jgi:hypothetical protein
VKLEREEKSVFSSKAQGCQIFLDTIYQYGEKYAKLPLNFQNGLQISQMAEIFSKCP